MAFALCAMCSAQNKTQLMIDGSRYPSQLPDRLAYRMVLIRMQHDDTHASLDHKVSKIGFSSADDAVVFKNVVREFSRDFQAIRDFRVNRDPLVQQYRDQLGRVLTTQGLRELDTFVQAEKSKMKVYGGLQ